MLKFLRNVLFCLHVYTIYRILHIISINWYKYIHSKKLYNYDTALNKHCHVNFVNETSKKLFIDGIIYEPV